MVINNRNYTGIIDQLLLGVNMLDILFIGAHPDDETSVSGLLIKAKNEGLSTGLIILTKGEAGGFADKDTRVKELKCASKVMDVDYLRNLDCGDSEIVFKDENVKRLIPLLVETQPKVVITIHDEDYHPDHKAVSQIVDRAVFLAGLKKYIGEHTWHPNQIFYVSLDPRTNTKRPDILIDISCVYQTKKSATNCYESQKIEENMDAHFKYLGQMAGCEYAEGLYIKQPLIINNVSKLFNEANIYR